MSENNREQLQRLKESINLVDFVRSLGLEVNSQNKMICFMHEDRTPSLHIYPTNAKCFSCGGKADVFQFLMKFRHMTFIQARDHLNSGRFHFDPKIERTEPKKPAPKVTKTWAECWQNEYFRARVHCLNALTFRLNFKTQQKIKDRKLPAKYINWLKFRGFDVEKTLFNFTDYNMMFVLEEVEVLSQFIKDAEPKYWEKSGLFRNGLLTQFSDEHCIVFPVFYPHMRGSDFYADVNSLRIRSCFENPTGQKVLELHRHLELKDMEFPSSFGFMGMGQACKEYSTNIKGKCAGLTVYLLEGEPDMIAAQLLWTDENRIFLSTGVCDRYTHQEIINVIRNAEKIIICFDNDEAGRQYRQKLLSVLSSVQLNLDSKVLTSQLPNNCKDINDYLKLTKGPK
jgi:5S rRNA maturation endonuclease (ribonuclease M5)